MHFVLLLLLLLVCDRTESSRVQRTIKSPKNTVRTGVFVGHAVRYPINSVPKPGA